MTHAQSQKHTAPFSVVFMAFTALALMASGCAHNRTRDAGTAGMSSGSTDSSGSLREILSRDTPSDQGAPRAQMKDVGDLVVRGIKLKNTQFDYPITITSRVEYWVDYFTVGRGRDYFGRYLERSEYFIPYIDPILQANNMPRDLVYLAMIESGFNNLARSHAKAVGPWQFISATGKRYGLAVNWWLDERRDVRKSTLSAVQYLKDLYGMFQSWELAAAAYNAGEAKVARAIQRYGTKDFWAITRQKFLRPETRDYVPKIIAAALISKNREQFGFPPARHDLLHPEQGEILAGDGSVVKVVKTDKPEQEVTAEDESDEVAASDTAPDDLPTGGAAGGAILKLPVVANEKDNTPQARVVPMPHISRDGKVSGQELAEFEVRSPADLLKVARAAGLSYHTVKSLNPELLRWCTPPNASSYRLRLPAEVKEQFLQTYNHVSYPRDVQFLAYKVRPGETLSHVARRYGIRVDPLAELNGVSPRTPLRTGQKVVLPMPNDRSRSLASLDLKDAPEKRRPGRRSRRQATHSERSPASRPFRVTYKKRESARQAAKRVGQAASARARRSEGS